MSGQPPPDERDTIEALLEAGDQDGARSLLEQTASGDERYLVLRVKLGLRDGSLEPGIAMQRMIALMRRDPEWPGAKETYQEASQAAYRSRQSSVSHSHPPPPPQSGNGEDS
jgi:hypothetical protein